MLQNPVLCLGESEKISLQWAAHAAWQGKLCGPLSACSLFKGTIFIKTVLKGQWLSAYEGHDLASKSKDSRNGSPLIPAELLLSTSIGADTPGLLCMAGVCWLNSQAQGHWTEGYSTD